MRNYNRKSDRVFITQSLTTTGRVMVTKEEVDKARVAAYAAEAATWTADAWAKEEADDAWSDYQKLKEEYENERRV